MPALPGASVPGVSRPSLPGSIGRLLPAISPSPAAYSPAQVRHLAYGQADAATMGPGQAAASGPGTLVLVAVAGAVVIATAGGWLAVTGRAVRKRRRA